VPAFAVVAPGSATAGFPGPFGPFSRRARTIASTSQPVAAASTAGVTPCLITGCSQPSPDGSAASACRAGR
jgi:hypothetical protein